MAWPNTPLTTYLAGMTPYIKAADLNAFQVAINGLVNGTLSVKSIVADGTGGNAASPAAGEVHVSRSVADSAIPSTATTDKGQLYKESCPTTMCSISGGFLTVYWGYGVYSVARGMAAAGDYVVVCKEVPHSNNEHRSVVQVTPSLDIAHDYISVVKSLDGANRLSLAITFQGAGADIDFDLSVWVM